MLMKALIQQKDTPSPCTLLILEVPSSLNDLGPKVSSFTTHKVSNGKIELWSRRYDVGNQFTVMSDDIAIIKERVGEIVQELSSRMTQEDFDALVFTTQAFTEALHDAYMEAYAMEAEFKPSPRISRKRGEKVRDD